MTQDEMRRAAELLHKEGVMQRMTHSPDRAREFQDLAAKLRAMADADAGWQPIETAPRDGTEIDVWCFDPNGEGYRVPDAWWLASLKRWRCHIDGGFRWTHQPTFWRPSPPPPEAK